MYLSIIFELCKSTLQSDNVAELILQYRTMVSFGISYDDSDNRSDDEEMDIINQQNYEFATRMVRAKTDHKRLKIIILHLGTTSMGTAS